MQECYLPLLRASKPPENHSPHDYKHKSKELILRAYREPCHSASAAFAGLVKFVWQSNFSRNGTILVNLTGADRSQANRAVAEPRILKAVGTRWEPEDSTDPRHRSVWSRAS